MASRSSPTSAERYPRSIEIRREGYWSTAARRLVSDLSAELLGRYHGRGGSGSEPAPSDFEDPDGAFLVGYVEGEPVACGGLCRYDERTAEIRRMYVALKARRRGLSRDLLGALEDEGRRLGYEAVRLETGEGQPEAIALYRSAGYGRIARYRRYVADERSVCFEKAL